MFIPNVQEAVEGWSLQVMQWKMSSSLDVVIGEALNTLILKLCRWLLSSFFHVLCNFWHEKEKKKSLFICGQPQLITDHHSFLFFFSGNQSAREQMKPISTSKNTKHHRTAVNNLQTFKPCPVYTQSNTTSLVHFYEGKGFPDVTSPFPWTFIPFLPRPGLPSGQAFRTRPPRPWKIKTTANL